MSLSIEFTIDEALMRQLDRIPELIRLGPMDRCLTALARPVVAKAKQLAPSSRSTGSRRKWSEKLKNDPKWAIDSGKHMSSKVHKGNKVTMVYIGAKCPKGNKQQFWANPKGKRAGRKVIQRPDPHFLQKAFDETRSQQVAAFNAQLAKELKELGLG